MRGHRPVWPVEEERGGGWLLTLAWLLVILPALLFAAWLALPPAWRGALGLPAPASQPPASVRVVLPALPGWDGTGANPQPAEAQADSAWRRNRAAPVAGEAPLVAVVLSGLGRSSQVTAGAIALPGPVGLALSPYGRPFGGLPAEARAAGHELLIELPIQGGAAAEGATDDALDLGPQALLPLLDGAQNLRRLAWLLDGPGGAPADEPLAGALILDGTGFLTAVDVAQPVLDELARRGLALLRAGGGADAEGGEADRAAPLAARAGLPYLPADQGGPGPLDVDAALAGAERVALLRGEALVVLPGDPATVARVAAWAATLPARGFALAPPTQVLERRLAEREAAE